MNAAERERAQALTGTGDADALTFSWADPEARLYGLARAGRSRAETGDGVAGSALAVLFSGGEPVAALARGGIKLSGDGGWERFSVPALEATVDVPLERWSVRFAGDGASFELGFDALGPPAELGEETAVARAGGMAGYEQVCRVQGAVHVGGRERRVRGLGQRGRAWGAPDWERIALTRVLGAWLADGTGVAFTAVRPASGRSHADEATWAALLGPAGALEVEEPRLSTTSDAEGHQRRAGLELWLGAGDDHPRRVAGEAVCGTTLDLGQLRLDCAFFRWHLERRTGVGRYDVLRRA